MRMIAWQYGLLEPLDWGEDCEREVRLQNVLWNQLVEIERGHRAAVAALVSADEPVAQIETAFGDIAAQIDAVIAERRASRKAARARVATPELDAQLDVLRGMRRDTAALLKEARATARAGKRDELKALADKRYKAITAARQQSGLWWGNYNAVCASFDVSLRRLGPGEEVRFHSGGGDGRVTNQIQGGIAAENFTADGHNQVWLEDLPAGHALLARGAGRRGRLKLLAATVYAHGHAMRRIVRWPIVLHRPFPAAARIKTVTINCRRVGPIRRRWTVAFSCEIGDVEAAARNAACGIDTGWRKIAAEQGGGLRVATLADTAGAVDHVVLPQRWLDHREWAVSVQQSGDDMLNALMPALRRIAGNPGDIPEPLAELWAIAVPPMAPGTRPRPRQRPLATLARRWRFECRSWRPELREELGRWLAQRIEYADLVDKLSLWRREIYRVAAKDISLRYGTVAVDQIALKRMSASAAAKEEMPPETRKMRSWAAPYGLVSEIRRATVAQGGKVVEIAGATTLTCHHCGHHNTPPAARRADLIWRCAGCRRLWDQDENAARNVLAIAAGTASALVPPPAPDKKAAQFVRSRITRKRTARNPDDNPLETGPK